MYLSNVSFKPNEALLTGSSVSLLLSAPLVWVEAQPDPRLTRSSAKIIGTTLICINLFTVSASQTCLTNCMNRARDVDI
jgi:hypothetical protein